jgi:hypothetical protein
MQFDGGRTAQEIRVSKRIRKYPRSGVELEFRSLSIPDHSKFPVCLSCQTYASSIHVEQMGACRS